MNDRDHFAAAALSGLLAANDNADMDEMIGSSWLWADAMLATRSRTTNEDLKTPSVRLPAKEQPTGPFAYGWNTALEIVAGRLKQAGVPWEVE